MANQGLDHSSPAHRGMNIQTPVKDIPPSFGFGSSSSPYFESPATVIQGSQSLHWSPQNFTKDELRSGSSHLLPSQFPPNAFGTLASSPPENGRTGSSSTPTDRSGSPQPAQIRRVGRRGRPRSKYFVQSEGEQINSETSQLPASDNTCAVGFTSQQPYAPSFSPQVQVQVPAQTLAVSKTHKKGVRKSAPKKTKPKGSSRHGPSVFTRTKTSNGVPLFSSRIFELACKHQSDIRSKEAAALRENLAKLGNSRSQFSTNGLGFNFSISTDGQVSIDTTNGLTATTSPNTSKARRLKRKLNMPEENGLIRDGMDSDSDTEDTNEESSTRTPPRFSSLGSCDAATAFAKSLARTNDRGNGFMFLFPPVSTPEKHGQLTSFVPCTPRTPRLANTFDEVSFNMQMQTPPGAIFTYENSNALYATGMTPYLRDMRGAN